MKIKLKVGMSHHSSSSLVLQTYAPFSSCALLYPTFYLRIFKTRENNCRNPDILEVSDFERFYFRKKFEFFRMAKVFIGNLSDDAKGSDVEDFFRKYGRLREITLKNGFGKFFLLSCSGI